MKVLHVCHQYYPARGGAERYCQSISEELVRRGCVVDVYTTRSIDFNSWRNVLEEHAVINGVRVRRFRSIVRRKHTWRLLDIGVRGTWNGKSRLYQLPVWYGNGPVMPSLPLEILRQHRNFDLINVIHLHYAHSWPSVRTAGLAQIPLVVTPLVHKEQPITYDFPFMRETLKRSQMLVALTRSEREFLKSELGNHRPEITVLGCGLKLDEYPVTMNSENAKTRLGIKPDSFVVLFLGTKTPHKGLDTLLTAFRHVIRDTPNATLLAVGPETAYSKKLWQNCQFSQHVVHLDNVHEQEKKVALQACDLLVLPSSGESFGIVFLEAWAYRKPVIGPSIDAVRSIIDVDVDGLLVDPCNPAALGREIVRLATNPDLRRQLGENGHRKLKTRYDIAKIGGLLESNYRRLIRRSRTNKGFKQCA